MVYSLCNTRGGGRLEQVIYGDVLLVINFSMDFLSLYLAAKLLHRPIRTLPMSVAAALGALYALLSLYLRGGNLVITLCNILASCLLVWVAFRPRRVAEFCKETALFYGIGFLLGGCMTALYNLCNSYLFSDKVYAFGNLSDLSAELTFGWFVVLAAVSAVISLALGWLFTRSAHRQTREVQVELLGRSVGLTLLCDSGNLLRDPISGTPVLVCAYGAISPILYPKLRAFFSDPSPARVSVLDSDGARRIRAIPMQGVGGGGMLFALRPDRVLVDGAAVSALVAVDVNRGSGEFGGTDGLIPPLA